MKSTVLTVALVTGMITGSRAEQFRTDINPAMQYYQAFQVTPDLSPADYDYLFNNEWRGQKLPERFGELVARYDNEFKLVRRAAQATVPCDWGIDMTPGPATLLPHLARCKGVAQAARFRVMWELQNDRPTDARDDLLGAFALARNSSRDGTLIAALVQIAMENIVCAIVAENYYEFSPEILKQLVDGIDAAPPRGTVAACIPMEQTFFHDWLLRKIQGLQRENPADDAKVMAGIRELLAGMGGSGDEGQNNQTQAELWEKVNQAAGGTSEGVVKLLREMEPLYQRLGAIMAAPLREYEDAAREFAAEIQKSTNPLVAEMFPAVQKCRPKEFGTQAITEMVRAAAEYKSRGEAGLKNVNDPCGQGPFDFQRFVFEGVDRGFQLKSAYDGRGYLETLIFVEKDGPPFPVIGKNAGQAQRK
jgi:hypothetical protein